MPAFLQRIADWVQDDWLILLVIAALIVAFVALRTPGSRVGSVAQVDAILAGGQPVLVEFYSNT